MIILGIETSCDETAISVVECGGGLGSPSFKVLGSALVSQMKLHAEYGGVYPNLAKREHIRNLPIVLDKALNEARIKRSKIDAIAITVGPGLEPALWTGINFAEKLSKEWGVALVPTNHMEGHIASVLINQNKIEFPALALLISGGHTELVLLKSWLEKEIIGETKDDAVGEAFDKVARMLGLPYPGGPEISKFAGEARAKNMYLETKFPRPMINSGDFNFSFSGLKTAVLYYLRDIGFSLLPSQGEKQGGEVEKEVAREFEDAVVEVLVEKSKKAITKYEPKTFIVGGGVIANNHLRESFQKMIGKFPNTTLQIPEKALTTDNAIMIVMAGYLSHISGAKQMSLIAKGNLKYS